MTLDGGRDRTPSSPVPLSGVPSDSPGPPVPDLCPSGGSGSPTTRSRRPGVGADRPVTAKRAKSTVSSSTGTGYYYRSWRSYVVFRCVGRSCTEKCALFHQVLRTRLGLDVPKDGERKGSHECLRGTWDESKNLRLTEILHDKSTPTLTSCEPVTSERLEGHLGGPPGVRETTVSTTRPTLRATSTTGPERTTRTVKL